VLFRSDRSAFTGGIGANAPLVRLAVCQGLQHLGVHLASDANEANAAVVSSPASAIPVHTLQTDEEAVIARLVAGHVRRQPLEEYSGDSPGQDQG
jgi:acetate kinase